ncbi:MAG: PHP domain-containing protein [Lachnospiraceae bacterium]|nr:PHP domain-containing protein [Lachnospiraceae bacterium]
MPYADLHMHTDYSDGVHTIEEVVSLARQKGIHTIAITDHDTVFHYEQVKAVCQNQGMETIRGVEMSCYDFNVLKKVHIVGLWLNDNPVHVEALCQKTLSCRDAYHHKQIEQMAQKGLAITYEDAKKYAPHNIVFKMHIFRALCEKYPEYREPQKYRQLFAGKTGREIDLQMGYIDIKEGIEAIITDGGIPVLAHPCEYGNYEEIPKYVSYGLRGIERSHPSMKEEDYRLTREFARTYHLLESGGSDFHSEALTAMGEFGVTQGQFAALKAGRGKTALH